MEADVEFLEHTRGIGQKVLCAQILYGESYYGDDEEDGSRTSFKAHYEKELYLHVGYTEEEWNKWLGKLHFRYNAGYGGQELFGTIWYEDMSYSDRYEYDGSECWSYHTAPEIPFQCFKKVENEDGSKEEYIGCNQ